jgi:hypothetical protein
MQESIYSPKSPSSEKFGQIMCRAMERWVNGRHRPWFAYFRCLKRSSTFLQHLVLLCADALIVPESMNLVDSIQDSFSNFHHPNFWTLRVYLLVQCS